MKETMFVVFKTVAMILTGAVLGGGVVSVVGQKEKNDLRQNVRRAQRIAERAVKDAETLQEELKKRR